ncbi:protein FAR1-RELATED SEQUENCE 8-like isoform X2 [Cornus florida]|nr:protein FAR1-RELATED SEQUENCE 8-like isoform X2 [Cornus florida]XP_059660010.1 protein FAR1-RELATED SEQUENCE 8-like isoform X2 [Cornus florida]
MEFETEDDAKKFYDEYARHAGFVMRIDQCRRSEVDRRILSRRLSCNKQGHYVKMRDGFGPIRKPRPTTREGCKAMMLVKVNKSGKWVVTRFEKEHTHPLVISGRPSRNAMETSTLDQEASHLARPLPIFQEEPSLVVSSLPLQVYSRRPCAPPQLLSSFLDSGSGTSLSHLHCPGPVPVPESRYLTRDCKPPARFEFVCSTDHSISQYISYNGLSGSY